MFGRLGAPEIILVLLVVVLLFGAKRLPDMARSFGQSLRILKSETKAMQKDDADEPSTPRHRSPPARGREPAHGPGGDRGRHLPPALKPRNHRPASGRCRT
ncbi:Sec-independent protein translocase subunit TatA (plasmid) [Streptomyces sp. NBC_01450]|uniref:Sec-independent protein translocase subunit TatA n=1 Tax=Streptomyces sp. NBC_01450 TaxID=2903871 RepID=UPI002E36DDA0|nr:Sec-independent protein translocase subunit TatA [Streptomyces sp. NBC_01450]